MAGPLDISDDPRGIVPGVGADVPLVTLAWRSIRAEHQRRAADAGKLPEALAALADGVFRLQRTVRAFSCAPEESGGRNDAQALAVVANGLEESLRVAGVDIVAPHEGEPYTAEQMELIDSVSQIPEPGALEPRIAELIEPAILYRGSLLRMGKAIIRVPERRADTLNDTDRDGEQRSQE